MKAKLLVSFVALSLATLVSTSAVAGQNRCDETDAPRTTPVNFVTTEWNRAARYYPDQYARCGSYITDLNNARRVAERKLHDFGYGAAADHLIAVLIEKSNSIPFVGVDSAFPHTLMAIKAGSNVLKTLLASTNRDPQMQRSSLLKGQLKWMIAVKVYDVVSKAFYDLDEKIAYASITRCFRNGCEESYSDEFPDYSEGVIDLATEFLNLQNSTGNKQGTDRTQINMTAAAAGAAKEVILNSLFNRDYSCAILELDSIEQDAKNFYCENPGANTARFVSELEGRLSAVSFPRSGCWQSHHRRR